MLAEASEADNSVVHHNGACRRNVDAERRRYLDHMVATIKHFHSKQKSGAQGLGRTEQIADVHGVVQSLHANAEIAAHFSPIV